MTRRSGRSGSGSERAGGGPAASGDAQRQEKTIAYRYAVFSEIPAHSQPLSSGQGKEPAEPQPTGC